MKKEKFQQIKDKVKSLSKINTDNLEEDIRKNIDMIQELTEIFYTEVRKLNKVKVKHDILYKQKYHELKFQSDEVLSYNEIVNIYLKGDEKISKLREVIEKESAQLDEIKGYIDLFKSKQFAVKDYISWRKFISLD